MNNRSRLFQAGTLFDSKTYEQFSFVIYNSQNNHDKEERKEDEEQEQEVISNVYSGANNLSNDDDDNDKVVVTKAELFGGMGGAPASNELAIASPKNSLGKQ